MRLVVVLIAGLLAGCGNPPESETAVIDVARLLGDDSLAGAFAAATEPGAIRLPRDHLAHPRFRAEWWYVTGNVASPAGRRFGFQLTFFRFATGPETDPITAEVSAWRSNHLYMAHLAVTDFSSGTHEFSERFSRDSLGLAGTAAEPVRIWVDDWQARGGEDLLPLSLSAIDPDGRFGVRMALAQGKPVVFHGDEGLSAKGPEPGNASYYYSYTRLPASGTITSGGTEYAVDGLAWIDREWSTSALGGDRQGWDWLSLQLADGRDLMIYVIRLGDGSPALQSSGTLVADDGTVTHLRTGDFELTAQRRWVSPVSGSSYPVAWRIAVPAHGIYLTVAAVLNDQEQLGLVRYWEGAVEARDSATGEPAGRGYLELTGY